LKDGRSEVDMFGGHWIEMAARAAIDCQGNLLISMGLGRHL